MSRKHIGVTRQIDNTGRISLPSEFRKELDINFGEDVEISLIEIEKNIKVIEIKKKGVTKK